MYGEHRSAQLGPLSPLPESDNEIRWIFNRIMLAAVTKTVENRLLYCADTCAR
jgi:hypothetical protein